MGLDDEDRASIRRSGDKAQRWAGKPGRKILLAEFLICMVIVGLGVLGVEQTKASSHAIRRVSALCALFFVLATVASWGDGPRRAANGIGGLVTLTFLVSERQGFTAVGNYFQGAQSSGDKDSSGPDPDAGAEAWSGVQEGLVQLGGISPTPSGEQPPLIGVVG